MRILPSAIFEKNTLCKIAFAIFTVAALAVVSPLQAQSKLVDKANELYKNNQFSDAAELYRQALQEMENEGKESRNATFLKSKLAYCYRINNKMDKAEALYAEVVKDETAKADNFYFYGESLMSNGKYEEAKKWFANYQKLEPTDVKVALMLRACDYAPLIEPYFQYLDIQEFVHNSDADDNAPVVIKNGLIFSSDRQQGVKLLKEKSGWTGRDYLNLYYSPRKADDSFAVPGQYSSKLSEVNKNTGNASLTADESELFFTRNDNELNKQNTYSLQLFSAKSGGENRWKDVEKLPFCSSNFNFMHPAVSPDGKLLFFATNRAGGFGGTDLWVSERKNGEWSKPENLGPAVNTTANEGFPFVGIDGKLYFCSKGHPGFGGFDIFVTFKDENGAWQPATNLGKPINCPLDDISIYVAPDMRSGMFTSSRSGGDDDIYLFTVLNEGPTVSPVVRTEPVAETLPNNPATQEEPAPVLEKEIVNTPPTTIEIEAPEMPAVEEKIEPTPVVEAVQVVPTEIKSEPPPTVVEEVVKVEESAPAPIEKPILPKEEKIGKPLESEINPAFEDKEKALSVAMQEPPAPIREIEPVTQQTVPEALAPAPTGFGQLGSFIDFSRKLDENTLIVGERFRLDRAIFDPSVWQLTPRIINQLNKLISQLKIYPSLQIEISTHTEALGVDEENLRISENRASTIVDYMLREGISKNRMLAKGCGETMPVNHCRNGTICSLDDHMVNQRIEVKVLALDGKW